MPCMIQLPITRRFSRANRHVTTGSARTYVVSAVPGAAPCTYCTLCQVLYVLRSIRQRRWIGKCVFQTTCGNPTCYCADHHACFKLLVAMQLVADHHGCVLDTEFKAMGTSITDLSNYAKEPSIDDVAKNYKAAVVATA